MSSKQAAAYMRNHETQWIKEFLDKEGFPFQGLTPWKRNGQLVYWEDRTVIGHNPITNEDVEAIRRNIKVTVPWNKKNANEFIVWAIDRHVKN